MEPLAQLLSTLRKGFGDRSTSVAVQQGVAPLLHHALAEAGLPSPAPLRRAYYETGANNINRLSALDALTQHCPSIVAIKGIDLARRVYPNIATRPMHDIDVWVADDAISEAERALASLGYRPAMPEMSKRLTRLVKHARLHVGGPRDSIGIDLHWSLVGHENDRRAPDLEWFRARASSGLEPTAHLLYLAAHMALQHYDDVRPLIWLIDFYLLAHSGEIDWRELRDAAERFGWTRAVASVHYEVEERLRLPLPGDLGPAAASIRCGARVKKGAERGWNELNTLDVRGRIALVRAWLFPDPAYLRWRYAPRWSWAWPFYYPVRWATSFLSGARFVLRRFRGDKISGPALLQSRHIP
jgi:hypothetical protein